MERRNGVASVVDGSSTQVEPQNVYVVTTNAESEQYTGLGLNKIPEKELGSRCRGICERLKISPTYNKGKLYDGTKKRCGICAVFFRYDGNNAMCPCCHWRCRTRVLRWGKRKEDTRIRI